MNLKSVISNLNSDNQIRIPYQIKIIWFFTSLVVNLYVSFFSLVVFLFFQSLWLIFFPCCFSLFQWGHMSNRIVYDTGQPVYYYPPGVVILPYPSFIAPYPSSPGVPMPPSPTISLRANVVKQIEYYFRWVFQTDCWNVQLPTTKNLLWSQLK